MRSLMNFLNILNIFEPESLAIFARRLHFLRLLYFHPIDQNFQSIIYTGNKTINPLYSTSISSRVKRLILLLTQFLDFSAKGRNCVKIIIGKSGLGRPGRGVLVNSDAPGQVEGWFKNPRFWRTPFVDGPKSPF